MRGKLQALIGVAVLTLATVGTTTAANADGWDLNTGWLTESVEETGLTGASCDFDGDGEATFYAVAPDQVTTLRLMVRWLEDVEHEEREVMLWRDFDGLVFETAAAFQSPSGFTADARFLTRAYVIETDDHVETGWSSVRGYGMFTDDDGQLLYRGPLQVEARFDVDSGTEYDSLVGPCVFLFQ